MRKNKNNIENERTLDDTLMTILACPGLEQRRRTQLASSLRTFSRVVGRAPVLISEDIVVIREEMHKASPARANIGSNTWATVRCSVMASLRVCGLSVISGRNKVPCSPGTRSLLDRLPAKPHRLALIALARWCAENGFELTEFDQQKSESFRLELALLHPKRGHHRIYLRAVKMWNRCQVEFPEFWPRNRINPRFKLDRYCFDESAFSSAFNADVDKMIADALKPPLRRQAPYRPIKRSTASKRRYTMYRVASAIAHHKGIGPCTFNSLADIVEPNAVEDALDFIEQRGVAEKSGDMHGIARTMHTVAKYYVHAEDSLLEALASIRKHVRPDDGPSQKNIDLCLMFKDARLQEDFLLMAERVMQRLRKKRVLSRSDAVQAQLAVVAALMIDAPMRSANIAQLILGVHILDTGWGTTRQVRVHVPGTDVKNEVAQNFLLRPSTVRLLDIYIKSFLPRLGKNLSGFLIPGRGSRHKRPSNLSVQLANLTTRELGVRMTAHQWRHVVGSIFLRYNPGEYEPVRRLLGHKRLETTMQFYTFMLQEDAQETIDSTFEELRQRGRHSYRRPRGRRAA